MSSSYTKVQFTNRQPDTNTAMKLNQLISDLSTAIGNAGTGGGTPASGVLTFNETPGGLINGSNLAFTSANAYVAGKLCVFLNGVRQRKAQDYNETGTTTFSFINPPMSGDTLSIDYQS